MIQIPLEIIHTAKNFFSNTFIQQGERLINQSRVILSFKKGSFEQYCVVSGLVKGDRSHEAKFSYKKRLENDSNGPLSSNCDCNLWNKKDHCPHTCALYLAFSLEKFLLETSPDLAQVIHRSHDMPPVAYRSIGVTPDEYGTIIDSPQRLHNAGPNANYQSLYYNLHNGKIVPFHAVDHFEGQIILNIYTTQEEVRNINNTSLLFSYQGKIGIPFDKISIFENSYLYNWDNGLAYELSTAQKIFIQKIRNHKYTWGPNEYLNQYNLYLREYFQDLDRKTDIHLHINNTDIEDLNLIYPKVRFKIHAAKIQSDTNNLTPDQNLEELKYESKYVDFDIEFFDDNENTTPLPKILSLFSFSGGALQGFKKKSEAYEFIKTFTHNLEFGGDEYKKILANCNLRNNFNQGIDEILKLDHSIFYYQNILYSYDNIFLKKLLIQIKKCFGETVFRFSKYDNVSFSYTFRLPAIDFLNGLSDLQKFATPYQCQIFYEKDYIKTWTSRVKFERRASTTKWFDLEIALGDDDFDIIKNADLSTGISITNKGLILLTEDQKDFIRLIKKYLSKENTKEEISIEYPIEKNKSKKYLIPFNRARIFEIFELQNFGQAHLLTEEELKICQKLTLLTEIPQYPIPLNLRETLRPYQITGYNWLKFLYENKLGACLADDMGLGKTLQTIAFLQSIYDGLEKVLIVCPVTILLNWEKEIHKFSNMECRIYHGGSRDIDGKEKILLTSYGVLKKEYNTTLSQYHFDVIILDEVQQLKNIRSLGAFAARSIKSSFNICLTGTPVENDLAEFYNILDLSIPGLWGDLQLVKVISNSESRSLARKTSAPFILRRTKSQVLTELPPKTENTIVLSFSEEEQKNYNQKLVLIRNRIQNSPSQRKYGEILKGLLELRQACLWQSNQNDKNKNLTSVKINFLLEQIEEILAEGNQAIIFSQFTTYLDIIQKMFEKNLWKTVRIDGSQNLKKRQEQVDLFQEKKAPLFLISLKAGGVGLNLTAASYVFIMDPWWNPAVESQAIDRAHRIGQLNNITVYRPIVKGTVEEKVLELQQMKKQLFQELLPESDDNLFTGKLSLKDFEFLFEKE